MKSKKLETEIMKKMKSGEMKPEKPLKLRKILWQKFCYFMDVSYLRDVFTGFTKLSIVITFALSLYYPAESLELLKEIVLFKDFYIPKVILGSVFILFIDTIFIETFYFFSSISLWPTKKQHKQSEIGMIFGVPSDEIINHLIEFHSFKQIACKKKFGLNQKQFDSIAKKLEKIGVLIRGENNSRIFNQKFTRENLSEIFYGKTSIDDIPLLWKKTDEGVSCFTSHRLAE